MINWLLGADHSPLETTIHAAPRRDAEIGLNASSTVSSRSGSSCASVTVPGVTMRTIPIATAVRQHFADIGHVESVHDVKYENAQARERTQILMDRVLEAYYGGREDGFWDRAWPGRGGAAASRTCC